MNMKERTSRKVFGSIALLGFFLLAIGVRADWKVGDTVPELTQFNLEGQLPPLEGKVAYIDFWASWCGPCRASFPAIERLYQKHREAGLEVLAISLDNSAAAMQRFKDQVKPSFPVVRDADQSLAAQTGLQYMPTSYLVDSQGVIREIHVGWDAAGSEEKLDAEIAALLQESKS